MGFKGSSMDSKDSNRGYSAAVPIPRDTLLEELEEEILSSKISGSGIILTNFTSRMAVPISRIAGKTLALLARLPRQC